jgi:hypothetical protein
MRIPGHANDWDNVAAMNEIERTKVEGRRLFEKDPLSSEPKEQLPSRQEIHNKKQLFPGLEAAVHLDDERVPDPRHDGLLHQNVLNVPRLAPQQSLRYDLHGVDGPGGPVPDLQDLPEAPHPDDLEQLKVLGRDVALGLLLRRSAGRHAIDVFQWSSARRWWVVH